MRKWGAWPFMLLAAVWGCGGGGSGGGAPDGGSGGGLVSCAVLETSGGMTVVMMCLEGTGIYGDQVRATCERPPAATPDPPQATISSAPCTRASALGACMLTTPAGSLTVWRYPDTTVRTAADVAATCVGGETFIAP